jgi:hypothetical protein
MFFLYSFCGFIILMAVPPTIVRVGGLFTAASCTKQDKQVSLNGQSEKWYDSHTMGEGKTFKYLRPVASLIWKTK